MAVPKPTRRILVRLAGGSGQRSSAGPAGDYAGLDDPDRMAVYYTALLVNAAWAIAQAQRRAAAPAPAPAPAGLGRDEG